MCENKSRLHLIWSRCAEVHGQWSEFARVAGAHFSQRTGAKNGILQRAAGTSEIFQYHRKRAISASPTFSNYKYLTLASDIHAGNSIWGKNVPIGDTDFSSISTFVTVTMQHNDDRHWLRNLEQQRFDSFCASSQDRNRCRAKGVSKGSKSKI